MREIPLSNCEYEFVTKCIEEQKRLDNRALLDYREIKICYKLDYGCCIVCMGQTKVLAQVVAEMDRPKESRSNEGNLGIFVEMSTMGSPSFDPAKPGEFGIELQRMLERSLLLSKAVDLEELCVRVGEQAWNISLHVQILSHDGNLLDCACIASIAALAHFKRPDVSVIGKEVTIHTFDEKNPISLTFNHQPFCITFAFFDNGTVTIMDPTKLEENCCDGKLIMSLNKHKEVCCTQMSGRLQVNSDQVLRCTNIAAKKAKELSEFIKTALENDVKAKKNGAKTSETLFSSVSRLKKESDETANTTTVNTKVSLPKITKEEERDLIQNDKKENSSSSSSKLSWIMKNSENTVTAGEDKVEDVSDIPMETNCQKSDEMESDDEEAPVVLQL